VEDLLGEDVFSPAWARRPGKPERIGPQAEFSFSNSLTFLSAAGRISFNFFGIGLQRRFKRLHFTLKIAHLADQMR
jgi:hypothetical protein